MRSIYFDTSALFKRYKQEKGTDAVDEIFSKNLPCYTATITLCEVVSNLRRLVDIEKIISEAEFNTIKAAFLADIGANRLVLIEPSPDIILSSVNICSKKYVTPLDSVHLATALSLPKGSVFLCSDKKLQRLAAEYGLDTIDPAGPAQGL